MRPTPASQAAYHLTAAGIAIRRLQTRAARAAPGQAEAAAHAAGIPALITEVETAAEVLAAPAARRLGPGASQVLRLAEVEELLASSVFVVDACRLLVRRGATEVAFASHPVLFAIARALAEAWPAPASREALLASAFGARHADDSHRTRLRVEVARLRVKVPPLADVRATKEGFALSPVGGREVVVVLAPLADEAQAGVLAQLADGEAWSSSVLALALGASQRTVQRALNSLAAAGRAESFGRGRARRWRAATVPGFPTTLLLPAPLPAG